MFLIKRRNPTLAWATILFLSAGASAIHSQSLAGREWAVNADLSRSNTALKARNEEVRVNLRGRPVVLHMYLPAEFSDNAPIVLYNSGSGGWHGFDQHIGTALAERGMLFFGISTHTYLKTFYRDDKPATFVEVVSDYAELIRQAKALTSAGDSRPFILAGWSLGAGYAPLIAADAGIKTNLCGIISISLSRNNETALSISHRLMSRLLGRTFGPSFDVSEYLSRVAPLPVAIIQAAKDRNASPRQAQHLINSIRPEGQPSLRLFEVNAGRNHSFSGGLAEFDHTLDEALNWIRANTPKRLTTDHSQTLKQPAVVYSTHSPS
jgi:hypothetical protein